ncbi:MAG: isocitrate dehydrogenase kinase/phosphatase AceK regulatory subunit [Pseudomonadota bacterium]
MAADKTHPPKPEGGRLSPPFLDHSSSAGRQFSPTSLWTATNPATPSLRAALATQTSNEKPGDEVIKAATDHLPTVEKILSVLTPSVPRTTRALVLSKAILAAFDAYYAESRNVPYEAKRAFEQRRWARSFQLSKVRLGEYGVKLNHLIPLLRTHWTELPDERGFWVELEAHYLDLIHRRYEADLAFAFLRSARRLMRRGEWAPVAYFAGRVSDAPDYDMGVDVVRTFPVAGSIRPKAVEHIIEIAKIDAPFRDLQADAELIATRINDELNRLGASVTRACALKVINAGFFRNRGAYVVGRLDFDAPVEIPSETGAGTVKMSSLPLAIAFLHNDDGVFADAVLLRSDEIHAVFSSTLATFHVTEEHYRELARFLKTIMPRRALGLHYSTIGFNHVGKVAVMRELQSEYNAGNEAFDFAPGKHGTVAIGFTRPGSRYVLKVIRDHPTDGYKWGEFDGVEAVLDKYRIVHESDRAGSMLDNIMYENVRLEKSWFSPELLQELINAAPCSVVILHRYVLFRHLIVQAKMTPLPIFFANAPQQLAEEAIRKLGDCIRNNAAANIFNRDLDARNYGISGINKVYLFDYDAVEPLVDVKIRTNVNREDGEEDIPDWFFEEGYVFLPEEMLVGLRIDDKHLRRLFRQMHADLMTIDYWEGMQRALRSGLLPKVRSYPPDRRLRRPARAA